MRKSHLLSRGNRWAVVAAAGLSPLFLAAGASAQTFAISIGVREQGFAGTAFPGIGGDGTATAGIEYINLDGQTLVADGSWQQFTFNFDSDPVTAFAGTSANGILEGTWGTLEMIRFRNSSGVADPIRLWVDTMVNTVSGSPTTVSGWEQTDPFPAFPPGQHMFRQPRFSGSTQGNLLASPDLAAVTDEVAQSGDQSYFFNMQFVDTDPARWARLTTFNAPGQPNPAIEWTPGSTLSFWLRAEVGVPAVVWTNTGSGNWHDPNNWTDGEIPNGINATANFLGAITGPATVSVDQPTTVNTIRLSSEFGYTIAGPETLVMDGSAQQPRNIVAELGSHTISAPIRVDVNTGTSAQMVFSVTRAQDTLSLTGPITMENFLPLTVVKTGPGTAVVSKLERNPDEFFETVGLAVNGGTLRLAPGGGLSRVNSLSIAGGVTPTARLDITNNPVVVDYAETSPINTIRQQIGAAFNNGAWDGNGITSSSANAGQFGIGYADASELTSVPPIFGTVDSTTMLLRLTRYGDANLDGLVNLADFNRLAANFGSTEATWADGDFNYDGLVNLADFNRLAANFGLQATGTDAPTPEDWSTLAAAVPEPSSLALVGLGALMAVRRRRA